MPKQEMGRDLSAGGAGTGANINGINSGDVLSANKPIIGSQPAPNAGQSTADRGVLDLAKESGGQMADKAIDTAKEKASSVVDEQKSNLAAGLGSIAGELRRTGENLRKSGDKNQFVGMGANYGEKIAAKVDGLSKYLENADLGDMAGDLKEYARRNPAVFIGGAFLLGLAATRFVKSASSATSGSGFENAKHMKNVNPTPSPGHTGL